MEGAAVEGAPETVGFVVKVGAKVDGAVAEEVVAGPELELIFKENPEAAGVEEGCPKLKPDPVEDVGAGAAEAPPNNGADAVVFVAVELGCPNESPEFAGAVLAAGVVPKGVEAGVVDAVGKLNPVLVGAVDVVELCWPKLKEPVPGAAVVEPKPPVLAVGVVLA